jgi:membrane-associated protease RseP (regulator of RpoE activity)
LSGPGPHRPLYIELVPAAEPGVFAALEPPRARQRWGLALGLLALTFLCATTLGPVMLEWTRTDVLSLEAPILSPHLVRAVWNSQDLLATGLAFSLPALAILLAHELGHYLACRRYRLPASLPYFLPAPLGFGTFGAFIRIQAPIRNRRELFDVGIAGPLAGFVALVPFLLYGVAHSTPGHLGELGGQGTLWWLGRPLAIELATWIFHGPLPPGTVLNLHPAAMAAWLGLLATALNLLPLGQLDGGHILHATVGRWQRPIAVAFWLFLLAAGFYWRGWWLWCVISIVLRLFHPPVGDEETPLDPARRRLAWVALAVFLLAFTPVPVAEIP